MFFTKLDQLFYTYSGNVHAEKPSFCLINQIVSNIMLFSRFQQQANWKKKLSSTVQNKEERPLEAFCNHTAVK